MGIRTYAVINDLQIPWQDKPVVDLVTDFIRDLKPHGIILNGDLTDCYSISDFNKDPERIKRWGIKREILEACELMSRFKDLKERWWLGGNHEDRWRRVQWQFPALQGMLMDFPKAFHMEDHGFKWKPYGGILKLGKLFVTHGSMVSKYSGQTARSHFDKYGNSILVGHTHRLGTFFRTNSRGMHAAYENGCLCQLNPEYVQSPDWQQGFSIVHTDDNGFYNVIQIPVLKRRVFFYGGERITR